MKTLLRLAMVAALVLCAARAEDDLDAPTVVDRERTVVTRYHVLNEAQLRERMKTARTWSDPTWFIHVSAADLKEASKLRSLKATNAKVKAWEREHEAFGNFVRNRIQAGSKGRRDEPQTFTFSPVEFVALFLDPSTRWTEALGAWANKEPGAVVMQSLAAAANTIKVIEAEKREPNDAELRHAEEAMRWSRAFDAARKGAANADDLAALRDFLAAMK